MVMVIVVEGRPKVSMHISSQATDAYETTPSAIISKRILIGASYEWSHRNLRGVVTVGGLLPRLVHALGEGRPSDYGARQ